MVVTISTSNYEELLMDSKILMEIMHRELVSTGMIANIMEQITAEEQNHWETK